MSSTQTIDINPEWYTLLQPEFEKPYFEKLKQFLRLEKQKGKTIYPPGSQIFSAFNHTSPKEVKVVILGQDPYHGPRQANGLCFSVSPGISHPPSLINIFKEIQSDLQLPYPKSGDLTPWAQQGVLLLNAVLTVEQGKAGAHQNKGWEIFTDAVIQTLSTHYPQIVFLLWGGYAKKKTKLIAKNNHLVLTSGHPSPLSANRGYWFGNKHFSQTNQFLNSLGKKGIDWKTE